MTTPPKHQPLRIGVLGLGRGFGLMLATFQKDSRIQMVSAYDPSHLARAQFETDFGVPSCPHETALFEHPDIEAIYIATPHHLHAQHVQRAAQNGKHVLVEKPMAISLDECQQMVSSCKQAGVVLMVGHSHSLDAPIQSALALISSGQIGAVRMINAFNYTDFLYRLRRPEELDTAQGGGVLFSQAAHQIDIVRCLGGGLVTQVMAHTGNWDPERATEGAYSALLHFASGAFASLVYSGYAHFDSDQWMGDVAELGTPRDANKHASARSRLKGAQASANESASKAEKNYGAAAWSSRPQTPKNAHEHFGPLIIGCERGDIRPMPTGLWVDQDHACVWHPLPIADVPRREVIDEWFAGIRDQAPLRHSGEWALANLEISLCMLASSRQCKPMRPRHQIPFAT